MKVKTSALLRNLFLAALCCCGVSAARAWDPNKPFIYEMRIAFETDKWINMYSTATVLSKSDNTVAFRVVANSTTTEAVYQLVVTTQGYVGIATASPAGLFTVGDGTLTVLSNGNVGIGTANPVYRLNVRNSATPIVWGSPSADIGFASYVGSDAVLGVLGANSLQFYASGAEKMRIAANGNLGIGTTAPGNKLYVNDYDASAPIAVFKQTHPSNEASIVIDSPSDSDGRNSRILLKRAGNLKWAIGGLYAIPGFNIATAEDSGSKMTILTSGYVGIGTTVPAHLLHLSGGAYCDGTGGWVSGSDRAYKKDIDYGFKYGLREIEKLKPVYYVHKQDAENRKQIGFIAQDVEKIVPEIVGGSEGSLGLSYERLTAVLVKAVQELELRVEELKAADKNNEAQKAEIEKLKSANEQLEKRLSALERNR